MWKPSTRILRSGRMASAARDGVPFKKYDNLNHFYQPGLGLATEADYATNTAPVDRRVIDDIAAWIKSR